MPVIGELEEAAVAIAEFFQVGGGEAEASGAGRRVDDAEDNVVFIGELDGGGARGEEFLGGVEGEECGGRAEEVRS